MPVTPEEEKEEKTVLALLGDYAAAQEELSRAGAALSAFVVSDVREKGWPALVHRQFLAEDKVVTTKNAARKAWEAYHLKKKG
jgi:hypothetical protein